MAQDQTLDENGNPVIKQVDPAEAKKAGAAEAGGTAAPKAYNPFDRTTFRDNWQAQGTAYAGDVNKFITDQNLDPNQFSQVSNTNGAWRLPTGEVMDLVMDKGGSNTAAWTGAGHMDTAGGPIRQYADSGSASQGGSASDGGGGSASGSTTASSSSSSRTPQMDALLAQLMQRAQQPLTADPNDPVIKGQTNAYNAQQTQAMRHYLSGLAESAGPNANIAAETRSANEQVGQNTSGFQAQLMGREIDAKRTEIQSALSEWGSLLSQDQQMALQKELALLDDATRRLGINTSAGLQQQQIDSNNDQFLANFGLNSTDAANKWDAARNPSSYPGLGNS